MIKLGIIAVIKTTEEPVAVLQELLYGNRSNFQAIPDDWQEFWVRRPVGGKDGVHHMQEKFYGWELESLDDVKAKQKADQEAYEAKLKQFNKGGQTFEVAAPDLQN